MFINRAGAAFYVHAFRVHAVNFVHSLGVEKNSAAHGNRPALGAASAAPRRYGDFIVICYLNHLRRFFGVFGAYHKVRFRHLSASVRPHAGQPKIIYAVRNPIDLLNRTVCFPHRKYLRA